MEISNTICPFCGVGCGLTVRTKRQNIIGVEPQINHPVSQGQLCAKGWNVAFAVRKYQRITRPLIKNNSKFVEVSWDQAISYIGEQLKDIISTGDHDQIGVISCARATNEDNYACQKFARAVLKNNNIDHCARICHSPSVAGLKQTLGSGAMTNRIQDIDFADVIVVFGADPTENHAILGGRIIRAKRNGAKLIVIDPRKTRLAELADIHLQLKLGSNIALVNGLLHIIFKHQWEDKLFIKNRCDGIVELKEQIRDYHPERVRKLTGISIDQLSETARLYSHAKSAFLAYGMGVTQFICGTDNVIAISNLVLACGQIGRKGTGVNPLRGQNNVQGACDMGCLPNLYPGYQSVEEASNQKKFSEAWSVNLSPRTGLTSLQMTQQALAQQFKAMLIFGEDPVVTDPDQNYVRRALSQLDLLVVAELSLTETARLADVILPAASFAEKEGTFTNCERRVQYFERAIRPQQEVKSDWQIVKAISRYLDSNLLDWSDSEAIFKEMTSLTPMLSSMTYEKLKKHHGLCWPCDDESPLGTEILHCHAFPIGRAKFIPVEHQYPQEQTDSDYPFALTTNRLHYHYGCGSMSRKSPILERETPLGVLFMNSQDAKELSLSYGQGVRVESRRGFIETRAVLTDEVPVGLVSIPYHFKESPSNQLTNNAHEQLTKMPELKACAVKITKLPENQKPRNIDQILREA